MASVIPALLAELGGAAASAALAQGAEKLAETAIPAIGNLLPGAGKVLGGVKQLLSGDIGGAIKSAVDYFGDRGTPTERVSSELAQADRNRPKDVARRFSPGPPRRRDKPYMVEEESMDDFDYDMIGDTNPDKISGIKEKAFASGVVKAAPMDSGVQFGAAVERDDKGKPMLGVKTESIHVVREDKKPTYWAEPAAANLSAPKRTPTVKIGGKKPVPGQPIGQTHFTRIRGGRLHPSQPMTANEKKQSMMVDLKDRKAELDLLERVHGPMDSMVREIRKQIAKSEYGNSDGPNLPERRIPNPVINGAIRARDQSMYRPHTISEALSMPRQLPRDPFFQTRAPPSQQVPSPVMPIMALGTKEPKKSSIKVKELAPPEVTISSKKLKGAEKAKAEKGSIKISVPKKALGK